MCLFVFLGLPMNTHRRVSPCDSLQKIKKKTKRYIECNMLPNSDLDNSNLQVPNMRNIAPKVHHGPIVW